MKKKPPTVLDCWYREYGYDTIYVRGECSDEEAVRLATDFVVNAREEHSGPWFKTERYQLTDFGQSKPNAPNLYRCVRCAHAVEVQHVFEHDYWDAHAPNRCPGCSAPCAEVVTVPRYGVGLRTFARWGFGDEEGERILNTHQRKGPGAFPCVLVIDLDDRDRRRAEEQACLAEKERAVARVATAYPEGTGFKANNYGTRPDQVSVLFEMPEVGPVGWHSDQPEQVTLHPDKHDDWGRLYGGRTLAAAR